MIRRQETIAVECFKCGEKGHKCRECPLWEKRKRVARMAKPQKVHQQERRLVCPIREKAQKERKLRRTEEEAVCMAKP